MSFLATGDILRTVSHYSADKPRWLVTGATGFLGFTLGMALGQDKHLIGVSRSGGSLRGYAESYAVDLRDSKSLNELIRSVRPSVVLHAAAVSGHEICSKLPIESFQVNVLATGRLAALSAEVGAGLIYISTDSVFSGLLGNYSEESHADPFSYYGETKLLAEELIQTSTANYLTVRTNFFGWSRTGHSSILEFFINSLRSGIAVPGFGDFVVTSLYAPKLIEYVHAAWETGFRGTLHVASSDAKSKLHFGKEVAKTFNLDADLVRQHSSASAKFDTSRTRNLSLNTSLLATILHLTPQSQEAGISEAKHDEERARAERGASRHLQDQPQAQSPHFVTSEASSKPGSLSYGSHDVDGDDVASVVHVLNSKWLTTGLQVDAFEQDLSQFLGGMETVVVSSGTAALHTAYAALGIGPGDEVITPPLTFVATQAMAVHLGAQVRFADVLPTTGTIDPASAEALITPNTKAIVAVDYAGHPADLEALRRLCDRHSIFLVVDAAHSLGSLLNGQHTAHFADITAFSFFPTKNITTGEGGAVATFDPLLAERARRFSRQGAVRDPAGQVLGEGPWLQEVHELGFNYRLSDLSCALGRNQLRRIAFFKERRANIKSFYDEAFKKSALPVQVPHQEHGASPMWHLYPLRVPASSRGKLYGFLHEHGILAQVNYVPVYWHPAFDPAVFPKGLCPEAEDYYRRELSLPIHTRLTEEDQNRVLDTIHAAPFDLSHA